MLNPTDLTIENNQFYILDAIGQSQRYRAYCQILINGVDVTNNLNPYLISVLVNDTAPWEAHIELDDRDGQLDIPPFNAPVTINLGWTSESSYRVFNGFIADVEHGFGRRLGGRRMFVHAMGNSQSGMAKTPLQDHLGDGAGPGQMQGTMIPFSQASQQFASNAGLTSSIGPTFQSTMRDYWSMNNESAMQWHSRFADDFGAFFRIEGSTIVFNALSDFNKPNIQAVWGDNLISWRIRPYAARSLWSGASQQYYDHMLGQWKEIANSFGLSSPFGASAIHKLPVPAPNANVAQQTTAGAQEKTNQYSGFGRIIINGEPQASWGGTVTIVGARPGVDGTYYIISADQSWSRQGYVTTLEVAPNPNDSTLQSGYTNVPTITTPPTTTTAPTGAPTTPQPVITNNADGSVTTVFPNGTITVQNALGTTTTNPDGTQTFTPPN
jgi:phage protein D